MGPILSILGYNHMIEAGPEGFYAGGAQFLRANHDDPKRRRTSRRSTKRRRTGEVKWTMWSSSEHETNAWL